MTEAEIIANTPKPRTRHSLAHDLRDLGVKSGMTLLVHSSLSSLGWVNGGPVAVIQAILDVLTPRGTLIMPTHSGDLSDPAIWENPPVPESWWPLIRETMPAYDPATTQTRGMGRIPESFRTMPNVLRSSHPAMSFAAIGASADVVTSTHALDFPLGEESPLAQICNLNGWVLLLGVGFDNNTSFHLSEYRIPDQPLEQLGAPLFVKGKHTWKTYRDIKLNPDPFTQIGEAFETKKDLFKGKVGSATCRLFRQRAAVDFAVEWLRSRAATSTPA